MLASLNTGQKRLLRDHLIQFVTGERKQRFDEVIANRIGHMHVVIEDVYQAHNASAVVRSADCFGIQYLHFIESRNRYKISGEVALGASQWVSVNRHKSAKEALQQLKDKGFKIVATTPHRHEKTLYDLDVKDKFALVFGTEKEGITSEVIGMADEFIKIPMYGFTESFNISVCAALCMHELGHRIRAEVKNCGLPEEEQETIYLQWLLASIRRSDLILKNFLKQKD